MKKQLIVPMIFLSCLSVSCFKGPSNENKHDDKPAEVVDSKDDNQEEIPEDASLELVLSGDSENGLDEIYINIDHVELVMENSDEENVDLAQNVGQVNISEYQDGSTLYLDDKDFKAGSKIKSFKLALADYDNYVVKDNGDYCDLKLAKNAEEKLRLQLEEMELAAGTSYRLNIDFHSSIIFKDNGVCLINPKLEVESFEEQDDYCDDEYDDCSCDGDDEEEEWDEEDDGDFWDDEES